MEPLICGSIDLCSAGERERESLGGSAAYCLRYSLHMAINVKKSGADARRRNQTRVSSKHQVTIPVSAFRGAGLEPGDTLKVEAAGVGRIVLTRLDELLDRYSGCLDTKGALRGRVEGLRGEWR